MEFDGVVGHDHQKRMLSILVERGKLPHALLFAGPRGIGKRTLALGLVKHLFCEKGTACNVCRPCRNLAAGHHPDLALLEGETSIKIDELREIRKEVFEPPYEAPVRVILIDNGEVMTREAANALLKTLEEPPPSNLFIIVTSREQEIPLTVRSRCMRIRFGPLSTDTVRAYYERALKLPEERAEALAAVSNGSIAAGLFWMDEEHSRMRQQVAALLMGEKRPFTKAALVAERMTAKGCEVDISHSSSLFSGTSGGSAAPMMPRGCSTGTWRQSWGGSPRETPDGRRSPSRASTRPSERFVTT